MKKIIIIFIVSSLSNILIAQDTIRTFQLGVNGYISYNGIGRANINPSVVTNYGKHTVFMGVLLVDKVDVLQKGYLPGLQLGYQFYPNGKEKIFDLFFEYDFDLLKVKMKNDTPTSLSFNQNDYYAMETLEVFNIEQYLGYGFNIQFLNHFYFTTTAGIGCGWYQRQFIYNCDNGEVIKMGDRKLYFGMPTGIFKTGIGFNFWPWKKNKK
jgi:hypothetical protein